jgi:hypothetical protein
MKTLCIVVLLGIVTPGIAAAQTVVAGTHRTAPAGRLRLAALGWMFTPRPHDGGGAPRTVEGIDDPAAITVAAQYGLANYLDVDAVLTGTEDVVAGGVGIGVELALTERLAVGLRIGAHADSFFTDFYANSTERFTVWGADGTASVRLRAHERLALYGGLRVSYELPTAKATFLDDSFVRWSVVPGVSYKWSEELELLGEAGLKLNDEALGYVGLGLAWTVQ